MYKNVINIVNEHYREGDISYAAVFRKYIFPVYPMGYHTFMKIVNMPGLDLKLEEEKRKINYKSIN
jgi:hypothetical protein